MCRNPCGLLMFINKHWPYQSPVIPNRSSLALCPLQSCSLPCRKESPSQSSLEKAANLLRRISDVFRLPITHYSQKINTQAYMRKIAMVLHPSARCRQMQRWMTSQVLAGSSTSVFTSFLERRSSGLQTAYPSLASLPIRSYNAFGST